MKRLPWMLVTTLWLATAAGPAAADQERPAMLTAVPPRRGQTAGTFLDTWPLNQVKTCKR